MYYFRAGCLLSESCATATLAQASSHVGTAFCKSGKRMRAESCTVVDAVPCIWQLLLSSGYVYMHEFVPTLQRPFGYPLFRLMSPLLAGHVFQLTWCKALCDYRY